MEPRELFERALRGDLDAAELCIAEIRRGLFSADEQYQLLLAIQAIKDKSEGLVYKLQQQLGRCDLVWYSSKKWKTWHVRDPWDRTRTMCGKGPYEAGKNGITENPTPEKAYYYEWTDEKGEPVPCGTCMNQLHKINGGTKNSLRELWGFQSPNALQQYRRRQTRRGY